jgi:hypothetical protein
MSAMNWCGSAVNCCVSIGKQISTPLPQKDLAKPIFNSPLSDFASDARDRNGYSNFSTSHKINYSIQLLIRITVKNSTPGPLR